MQNVEMKKIAVPLLVLAVAAVGIVVYSKHPILATNADVKKTESALDEAALIQAKLSHTGDASQMAGAGAAFPDKVVVASTERDMAAQHLLNEVQGVLGQLEYKLQTESAGQVQ